MTGQTRWDFLSKLDDDRLIALQRDGNLWAGDRLIIRHTHLVSSRVRAMVDKDADFDDVMQEGMLGLLAAVASYDARKNASFVTFAYRCITNRILNWLRKNHSGDAHMAGSYIDIEQLDEQLLADGKLDPQEILENQEALDQWSEKFSRILTRLEKSVLTLYYSGCSYEDIGKTLGVSGKSVDNALQRVRKKLSK